MATSRLFVCNKPPRLTIRDKTWTTKLSTCLNLLFLLGSSLLPKGAKRPMISSPLLTIKKKIKLGPCYLQTQQTVLQKQIGFFEFIDKPVKCTLVENIPSLKDKNEIASQRSAWGNTEKKSSQIAHVTAGIRTWLECYFKRWKEITKYKTVYFSCKWKKPILSCFCWKQSLEGVCSSVRSHTPYASDLRL